MSGGSMNYIFLRLEEAADMTKDKEIKNLLLDLSKVLHDEEWYKSADYGEESYLKTLKEFKDKWFGFGTSRNERLKKYVDEEVEKVKKELYVLIGVDLRGEENVSK